MAGESILHVEEEKRSSKLNPIQKELFFERESSRTDFCKRYEPDEFESRKHYYPRVLNSQLHPFVSFFFNLSTEQMVKRYCHLHPQANSEALLSALKYVPKYLRWAGSDLFYVTNEVGNRAMLIVETNSCPSGQKSMPHLSDDDEYGCYRKLVELTFKPMVLEAQKNQSDFIHEGVLAVLYDKNIMEASGYAAALATVFNEPVYLVECRDFTSYTRPGETSPPDLVRVKWSEDGVCHIKVTPEEKWLPVRACFRYVTQRPWNRIPVDSRTLILNPTVVCLAGGRNKSLAALAYDLYNKELKHHGFQITVPQTFREVSKRDVPAFVEWLGGRAVVKNPYSNAGQGVYTVTNEKELNDLMQGHHDYDQFIVQQLIGNAEWSSITSKTRYYHVGTMPSAKYLTSYVYDLRMMVCATSKGYRPLAMYSRQASAPLPEQLSEGHDSWTILGTNLSVRKDDGAWDTETDRLMLVDRKDFNRLGLGIDDLIKAFIQTALATSAIDKMCCKLINEHTGSLNLSLLATMNPDKALLAEVLQGTPSLKTQHPNAPLHTSDLSFSDLDLALNQEPHTQILDHYTQKKK